MTETIPERAKPTLHHIILGTHLPSITIVYFSGAVMPSPTHPRASPFIDGAATCSQPRASLLSACGRGWWAGGGLDQQPTRSVSKRLELVPVRLSRAAV